MSTETENITPEQRTEIKQLVDQLGNKSFDLGFIEGKEDGYGKGYGDGYEAAFKDLDLEPEVAEDETLCCQFEKHVLETVAAVRALLLNGADDVHVERVNDNFVVSSEQTV